MKRKALSILILLMLSMTVPMVLAVKPNGPSASNGLAKKGKTKHLYLYEKDHTTPEWNVVEDGAWGKLTFHTESKFVFNGHGLEPDLSYTLIYYGKWDEGNEVWINDVWPHATCLGSGTANDDGNVHIMDDFDFASLPQGAKIWLVLSEDVDCDENAMTGWTPSEYLFEYDVLNLSPL